MTERGEEGEEEEEELPPQTKGVEKAATRQQPEYEGNIHGMQLTGKKRER